VDRIHSSFHNPETFFDSGKVSFKGSTAVDKMKKLIKLPFYEPVVAGSGVEPETFGL
jgi:hypothetical protein